MAGNMDIRQRHHVVLYQIFEEIDYTVPEFSVLHVRLHRCRIALLTEEGDEDPPIDAFINSSKLHDWMLPDIIIPVESCDIPVLLAIPWLVYLYISMLV